VKMPKAGRLHMGRARRPSRRRSRSGRDDTSTLKLKEIVGVIIVLLLLRQPGQRVRQLPLLMPRVTPRNEPARAGLDLSISSGRRYGMHFWARRQGRRRGRAPRGLRLRGRGRQHLRPPRHHAPRHPALSGVVRPARRPEFGGSHDRELCRGGNDGSGYRDLGPGHGIDGQAGQAVERAGQQAQHGGLAQARRGQGLLDHVRARPRGELPAGGGGQ
ncbi:hypothetical protein T310_9801, partial [Rasamsonia emersonii CBS 393.64]